MIPIAIPAAVKALPWRLILGAVLLLVVALFGWRATVWRESHHALQATEKALETVTAERDRYAAAEAVAWQALQEAEGKAKEREAADRATAERIASELQTRLAAADARGRDLARRLRLHAARACPGAGAVPGTAGGSGLTAGTAGEPGDGEAIERATADHLSACARDAERLAGWQEWWGEVSAGR